MELVGRLPGGGLFFALHLPALAPARERARRTVCRQQQQQLTVALDIYGGDNEEALPAADDTNARTRPQAIFLPLIATNTLRIFVRYAAKSNLLDCPDLHAVLVRSNGWRWPMGPSRVQ